MEISDTGMLISIIVMQVLSKDGLMKVSHYFIKIGESLIFRLTPILMLLYIKLQRVSYKIL